MSSTGTIEVRRDYIKSPIGIVTIVEAVLSLVTFICAMVWRGGGGAQWVQFVAIMGFIIALAFFILNLLNVYSKLTAVPWMLLELIVSAVWSVFFLIAGIVAAVYAGKLQSYIYIYINTSSVTAAAVFCFLSLIAWVVGTILLFKRWKDAGGVVTTTTTTKTTTVESVPPATT